MSVFKQRFVMGGISALVFVLAACGSSTTAATPTPTPAETPSPVASPAASPSATAGYTAPFVAEGPAVGTVSGTVTVTPGSGSFTVVVDLTGLAANSSHPSHIHDGATCAAGGPIDIALQTVVADATGHATTTSVIPSAYAVPASGWYINVHQGPDLVGANATPIACVVLQ